MLYSISSCLLLRMSKVRSDVFRLCRLSADNYRGCINLFFFEVIKLFRMSDAVLIVPWLHANVIFSQPFVAFYWSAFRAHSIIRWDNTGNLKLNSFRSIFGGNLQSTEVESHLNKESTCDATWLAAKSNDLQQADLWLISCETQQAGFFASLPSQCESHSSTQICSY